MVATKSTICSLEL